jgi:hypothetical protein
LVAYKEFFETFSSALILESLENELKHRLDRYKKLDRTFRDKYGIPFEEFEKSKILDEKGYSWEVERDLVEWEHAVEGIRYCKQKLEELQKWKTSLLLQR